MLLFMIVIALLTPWIAPYSYEAQNLDLGASPPSAAHWLGTDIFGRDLLTQVMYGGRISLAVGFIATAVALLIGVTWGAIAGYVGGRVDAIMMRLVDILYALPFMIFIVLLMVVFGRNILLLRSKSSHQPREQRSFANDSRDRPGTGQSQPRHSSRFTQDFH